MNSAGDLHIPLQAAGDGGVGQVGGTRIGGGEASVPIKDIRLGVESGALYIATALASGVGQRPQLLNCLHIGGPHVGGGDEPQLFCPLPAEGPALVKAQEAALSAGQRSV